MPGVNNSIRIISQSRSFVLAANTLEERLAWVQVIVAAVHVAVFVAIVCWSLKLSVDIASMLVTMSRGLSEAPFHAAYMTRRMLIP